MKLALSPAAKPVRMISTRYSVIGLLDLIGYRLRSYIQHLVVTLCSIHARQKIFEIVFLAALRNNWWWRLNGFWFWFRVSDSWARFKSTGVLCSVEITGKRQSVNCSQGISFLHTTECDKFSQRDLTFDSR